MARASEEDGSGGAGGLPAALQPDGELWEAWSLAAASALQTAVSWRER